MAQYRVLISSATDPADFQAELPFSSLSYTETLNDSGSCTVTLPLVIEDPEALQIMTKANLDTASTLVWVEREGVLVWGGIVWGISGNVGGNTLTVNASGFHSYLRRRVIRKRANYVAQDQLAVARSLVDLAEDVAGSLGIISTSATNTSGKVINRLYNAWDRKPFGEAIEQLAEVESGFDFSYQVAYDVNGTPTVEFVTDYPALGRATNYVFDLDGNAEALSFTRDGSARVNEVDALGAGEGPNKRILTRTNPAALSTEPLLQSTVTVGDVVIADTLSNHAGRVLSRGADSAVQYAISVDPAGVPGITEYRLGDIVELRASYGYLDDSGDYRIVQKAVSADSSGESVNLSLTNIVLFSDIPH